MTWADLLKKYGRNYISEVMGFNVGNDTVIQFTSWGTVSVIHNRVENWEMIDIAKDRTPEQMDAIITALTEKQ